MTTAIIQMMVHELFCAKVSFGFSDVFALLLAFAEASHSNSSGDEES